MVAILSHYVLGVIFYMTTVKQYRLLNHKYRSKIPEFPICSEELNFYHILQIV